MEHRVPILSNIPYFGKRLFTHISEIETKTDLVIQITPKIVYDNYTGIEKSILHKRTEKSLIINEENEQRKAEDRKKMRKKFLY